MRRRIFEVVSGLEGELGQIPNKVSQILPQPAPIRATMLGGAAFPRTRPEPSVRLGVLLEGTIEATETTRFVLAMRAISLRRSQPSGDKEQRGLLYCQISVGKRSLRPAPGRLS